MEENSCDICSGMEGCEEALYEGEATVEADDDAAMPTREEYEALMSGVFKEFYDADMNSIKEDAMAAAKKLSEEQRENAIKEAERALLSKIRAKNQRISEIGTMKNHGNAKRRVSDMTKEERAAVAKRAARGEIINLK